MRRLCVIGLGRVGLPTAVCARAAGWDVTGVDHDPAVREAIAEGTAGRLEPGLPEALAERPLRVVARPVPSEVHVVCVGRPADGGLDGGPATQIRHALAEIAALDGPERPLVVLECTVPVGTTDALSAEFDGLRLTVAPERVLPGRALEEIRGNPRLVGGRPDDAAAAADVLATWCRGPISVVDARTAELAKLVENTARDVEIALANTVAGVAREHGVDPVRLRDLVNQHPRVHLLLPGIGVGGPCLPVDPWLLADASPLVRAARAVNDAAPREAAARIDRESGRLGLLGLAYKPDTDDVRRSPAIEVARALAGHRDVLAHDPHVPRVDGLRTGSIEEVLSRDVVVLLVAHAAFHGWRDRLRPGAVGLDLVAGWP